MCTVTLNINENQVRLANPSLNNMDAITRWVQHLLDVCIADLAMDRQTHLQDAEGLKPYTIEELHARIEKSERESIAGLGIDNDVLFRELEEEFAREEEPSLSMVL